MRKLLKPNAISPEVIEAVKKDRMSHALNELVFKYNISYQNISMICKGIDRQKTVINYRQENIYSQG
ncbi:hypothetical protein F0919_01805 [Taibaiella lutea]|uniref:Mor transcription activator domain-containing protein n=1 Tax=Taibaiella lutea TaxID=2608001 RepID=A0A5M6CN42_9BACT|nr:hypothetical protein [Taibaiella lutea]KAA5536426.1 hypothetical protein F0919_01805 [Taibaiella lutea]